MDNYRFKFEDCISNQRSQSKYKFQRLEEDEDYFQTTRFYEKYLSL